MKRRNVKRLRDAKNAQQKQIVLLIGMFFSGMGLLFCAAARRRKGYDLRKADPDIF